MIGQYFSHTNENTTVLISQKILKLNKASVCAPRPALAALMTTDEDQEARLTSVAH